MKTLNKLKFHWLPKAVLFLSGFINHLQAQYTVDKYFFQQQIGSYTEISGGTVLGTINIDEEVFNASLTGSSSIVTGAGFPIGFPFSLGGSVFTRFAVGTNGYIKLGNDNFAIANSVSGAFNGSPFNLQDTLAFANMIAALHSDLQGQTGSELSFKTIGTEPNRECVIQWKKFRIYLATGDDFNFQIRLKENGNQIVFSYGSFVKTSNPNLTSVGIRGNAFNVVYMRKAQQVAGETWSTSSKSLDRLRQSDLVNGFIPDNGLTYTFYSPTQTANDVGLEKASLSPNISFGCPGSSTEPIFLRVYNYGDSAQMTLPYKIRINNAAVLEDTAELNPPLLKNQFRILTLNQTLDLSGPGELNVKIWSELPGDTGIYTLNDTAAIKTSIFAPAATPAPPIKSYDEFLSKGWKSYRGKNKPKTNNGRFGSGFQFASGTTSIQILAFSTDTIFDWLVSPAYQPTPNLRLKFRAAITGFDTINPHSGGIDNDEIRFMISDDCGETWNTLLMFDNSSVSSGVLNNVKKGFSVPVPPVNGPFQLAVFVNSKGTNPQNTYNFHLDDLTLNQGNSYDLATSKVSIENQNNPNCDQTGFTVKAWIKNTGDSSISSSAASVKVNNQSPQIQDFTFNPPLQAGDSAQITFSSVTVSPNAGIRLIVRTLLSSEDGFSSANDTSSISFLYIGASNPIQVPSVINFDNLPSGVPAGWLVEQTQGTDFKIRIRGTNSSKSLSTNMYNGNKNSFAIAPTTAPLPANTILTFDLRLKNDLAGAFSFGSGDSVTLSISSDCGNSWIPVFKTKAGQPFGFDNFQTASIDLAPYTGSALATRFDVWMNRTDNTGAWVDIDNIRFLPNTGNQDILREGHLSFYPNPARESLRIRSLDSGKPAVVRIINSAGQVLMTKNMGSENTISVQHLPSGIYLLEQNSSDGIRRGKFVKE